MGSRREEELATFEGVEVEYESDKALLCIIPGHEDKIWIPKSQLREGNELKEKGDKGELVVTEWLATQKNLL